MENVNWVDALLLVFIALSMLLSLWRGFVREMMSVLSWLLALFVAYVCGPKLAIFLSRWVSHHWVQVGLAYLILAALTLVVMGMVTLLVQKVVKASGLGGLDRLLGMAFGFVRGILIAFLVVVLGRAFVPEGQWRDWSASRLVPHFMAVQGWSFSNSKGIYNALHDSLAHSDLLSFPHDHNRAPEDEPFEQELFEQEDFFRDQRF